MLSSIGILMPFLNIGAKKKPCSVGLFRNIYPHLRFLVASSILESDSSTTNVRRSVCLSASSEIPLSN